MSLWFYYDENNNKSGPVNDAQLIALAARGIILPETAVETETGQRGMAKQVPGLKFSPGSTAIPDPVGSVGSDGHAYAPPSMNIPIPPSAARRQRTAPAKLLDKYYKRYIYGLIAEIVLILTVVFALLIHYVVLRAASTHHSGTISNFLVLFSFAFWCVVTVVQIAIPLVTTCYWFMFLYVAWSMVPEKYAKTTPNKGVGYCFIPFFSFYWVFVAYQGVAEGMNKSLAEKGIDIRASEGKGTILAVLTCWMPFPYIVFLVAIPFIIFSILYMRSIKKAGAAFSNTMPMSGAQGKN